MHPCKAATPLLAHGVGEGVGCVKMAPAVPVCPNPLTTVARCGVGVGVEACSTVVLPADIALRAAVVLGSEAGAVTVDGAATAADMPPGGPTAEASSVSRHVKVTTREARMWRIVVVPPFQGGASIRLATAGGYRKNYAFPVSLTSIRSSTGAQV
jgi:hypothetical protein